MKNKVGFFSKIACKIVGWNPRILQECSEASYRTLYRYAAAIIILTLIWGTIGYCFAERYIGIESISGKLLVSSAFIMMIICIERFIILQIGKNKFSVVFRVVLAFLMAALGSTIFDQIIFKHDVDVKMAEVRTELINQEVPKRMLNFEADIKQLSYQIDSVAQENILLYERISQKPVIQTTDVSTTTKTMGYDEDGNPIKEVITNVNRRDVENPIMGQIKANELALANYQKQLEDFQQQKLNVQRDVTDYYQNARVGFLQELTTLFKILFDDPVAITFYIFLFCFLMSLELLVVTTKAGGDNSCDYDLIIDHQLKIKKKTLEATERSLIN